ncbi:hypothetical protein BLNAU_125 [Blattamonas nauphoetae]|uniref:ABC transporter domain-containing protein n=2 Tax=Blattamonas nauphoetae TaxID=2049346 RepID=A0ABQ9Y7G0_9EUKA|nr:hypothetical protein BLNAU_20165 [Blattamonas nauphoetae]KAK2954072.1 hypothetical protein BLNAU_11035 [Blattamonas nauphoetae]KAK2959658.1 hypothetical protein BLNAU_5436 [Blattamonas nauphoetae]KAK2964825.1 hypothetical protein BLNAU_125 [Blattamonas nauphoetae]
MKKDDDDNTWIPDNNSVDPSQLQLSSLDSVPLLGLNDAWGGRRFVGDQAVLMPQDPFVQDTSLRSINLYGSELDKTRLECVVRACCFNTDEKAKPDGLNTFVGGHRRKLSGGQKQRMCLAHVCYSILMQREADSNTSSDSDSESNHKQAGEGHSGMERVVLLNSPRSACNIQAADTPLEEGYAVPTIHSAPSPSHTMDKIDGNEEGAETESAVQSTCVITLHAIVSLFIVSVLKTLADTAVAPLEEALKEKQRKDAQTDTRSDSFNLDNIVSEAPAICQMGPGEIIVRIVAEVQDQSDCHAIGRCHKCVIVCQTRQHFHQTLAARRGCDPKAVRAAFGKRT